MSRVRPVLLDGGQLVIMLGDEQLILGRPLVDITDRALHIVFTVSRRRQHRPGALATDTRRQEI